MFNSNKLIHREIHVRAIRIRNETLGGPKTILILKKSSAKSRNNSQTFSDHDERLHTKIAVFEHVFIRCFFLPRYFGSKYILKQFYWFFFFHLSGTKYNKRSCCCLSILPADVAVNSGIHGVFIILPHRYNIPLDTVRRNETITPTIVHKLSTRSTGSATGISYPANPLLCTAPA